MRTCWIAGALERIEHLEKNTWGDGASEERNELRRELNAHGPMALVSTLKVTFPSAEDKVRILHLISMLVPVKHWCECPYHHAVRKTLWESVLGGGRTTVYELEFEGLSIGSALRFVLTKLNCGDDLFRGCSASGSVEILSDDPEITIVTANANGVRVTERSVLPAERDDEVIPF